MFDAAPFPAVAPDTLSLGRDQEVAQSPRSDATHTVTWQPPAESFLILGLRNFGLTLATCGLYYFWARVETRRRVHRAIHIDGTPLDYTGSGREGLISFVIGGVIAVAIVTLFLATFSRPQISSLGVGQAGFPWRRFMITFPLMFLLGSIAYRKRKEVLRRTWWRGERFDLKGEAWSYAWMHFWTAFLVPLTLGWAAPWRAARLERRKIEEMQLGASSFQARPSIVPLYRAFAQLWFCGGLIYVTMLVLLGLFVGEPVAEALRGLTIKPMLVPGVAQTAIAIATVCLIPCMILLTAYQAAWLRHQVSSIELNEQRLSLALPTWPFIQLVAANTLMRAVSLGALTPVAEARFAKFLVRHLRVQGVAAAA
jgi:uncharacterized membrane protein YjgN (DUF898 family)